MSTGLLVAIGTIAGTLLLCGIVVWLVLAKTRKEAYEGVVEQKKEEEREGTQDDSYTVYTLVVKTSSGQLKNVKVGKKIWEQFTVGDKIVKEPGKFNPVKG